MKSNRTRRNRRKLLGSFFSRAVLIMLMMPGFFFLFKGSGPVYGAPPVAKYVILMIADGWGAKQIEATNQYCLNEGTCDSTPAYQGAGWTENWISTYPDGGSYNGSSVWSTFDYVLTGSVTDSAAAATVLYSGVKTDNELLSVDPLFSRLFTIGEKAKSLNKTVGAISNVPASHATPGAWVAHNDDRDNTYAIADEGFFGDPAFTQSSAPPGEQGRYGGGHGLTMPPADVFMGDGAYTYINAVITDQLVDDHAAEDRWLVDCRGGAISNCGSALNSAAGATWPVSLEPVTKLAGLFTRVNHLADDSGYNPSAPTLAEMANAAITVLDKDPDGFALMVEGGDVDWAGHGNHMDRLIGAMNDFNEAVQAVSDWINDGTNGSNWLNTLLIVTGDHETGYLTRDFGVFPNVALGLVNETTVTNEKIALGPNRRASWDDDGDNVIEAGETVHWAWNTGGHSNSLIPLYCRGVGCDFFPDFYEATPDPVRGDYFDNQHVWTVMNEAISDGDGILEDGDFSGTAGDNPCTGGNTMNCDDNCSLTPNSGQQNTNGDSYGNACDADLDNDGFVGPNDYTMFGSAWWSNSSSPNWNPDADFDSDGFIGPNDYTIFGTRWWTGAPWY